MTAIHSTKISPANKNKNKTEYMCQACAATSPKWQGQCPNCGEWNTLVESVRQSTPSRFQSLAKTVPLTTLGAVNLADTPRITSGSSEFDRALGGGLVQGGVILLGGDPGIGKSTLLLQTLVAVGVRYPVLYVSGEESAQQIALRAHRLGLQADSLPLLTEIRLEAILETLSDIRPTIAVIDSIQTIYSEVLTAAPGSVSQVRECAAQLTRFAKQQNIALVLIGHVTKDGAIAGPRVLEHIVDTVLYFEGDQHSSYRMVRASKNRFGAVNELGVFAMTDKGIKGVNNPSALFLANNREGVAGSAVLVTQEGTRPLLVEIQALVDTSHGGLPKRLTVGLEAQRLAMLLAVLHRHAGVSCHDQDVFLNAVGGVKIAEPAADLAVLLAIVSSLKNRPLAHGTAVFGEVGLSGEIRPVQRGQDRLKEAVKLGFTRVIVPKANAPKEIPAGVQVLSVVTLGDALDAAWGD